MKSRENYFEDCRKYLISKGETLSNTVSSCSVYAKNMSEKEYGASMKTGGASISVRTTDHSYGTLIVIVVLVLMIILITKVLNLW